MIHLIVATTSEAKPLIDYFLLKKKTTIHGYNFYQNEIISLTISGVGKINASISVAHTFFKFNKSYFTLSNNKKYSSCRKTFLL